MKEDIRAYNNKQTTADKEICDLLATTIGSELTEAETDSSEGVFLIDPHG